jgi:hypothetical protein
MSKQVSLWHELVASLKSHIADLQKEIKRLENLVQVLSDDKFFKPDVLAHPTPPTETVIPFEENDFVFQTESGDITTDQDLDISAELAILQQSYDEHKDGTK